MIERLVLVGATGDLAGRFLFPALAHLISGNKLDNDLTVVGAARDDLDVDSFREQVRAQLDQHAKDLPADAKTALLRSTTYRAVDLGDPDSVTSVLDLARGSDAAVAVYLALPPSLFPTTLESLRTVGLPPGSRIAIEKPFGEDLASAISLDRLLLEAVGEEGERAAFRVDHVLGMSPTWNLLHLRESNGVLASVWNVEHIEQVDILWEETLGLEGRAAFYDRTGALKDVMQNHMMQLLSLVTMELPGDFEGPALHDAKLAALRSIRPLTDDQVVSCTRRARYRAGRLAETGGADGATVPDYAKEEGVDAGRKTETFAELELELESWPGTRFRLRAGKALAARRKGIVVHFRPDAASQLPGNELWIGIDGPDGVSFDGSPDLGAAPGEAADAALPPYANVLLDILSGDSTLSVGGQEAQQAWRVVTPVLDAWAEDRVPLEEYPAGSSGP